MRRPRAAEPPAAPAGRGGGGWSSPQPLVTALRQPSSVRVDRDRDALRDAERHFGRGRTPGLLLASSRVPRTLKVITADGQHETRIRCPPAAGSWADWPPRWALSPCRPGAPCDSSGIATAPRLHAYCMGLAGEVSADHAVRNPSEGAGDALAARRAATAPRIAPPLAAAMAAAPS